MAHIVVAPDSFKGSIDAAPAASAIAQGWLAVRPHDTITVLPQADGGEGTLDAINAASAGVTVHGPVDVRGPDGRRTQASWLELIDGTAVVELATTAGLPLMKTLDALGASTWGLGELLSHVLDAKPRRLVIALGGSATTDGAAGAFAALGLRGTGGAGGAGDASGVFSGGLTAPANRGSVSSSGAIDSHASSVDSRRPGWPDELTSVDLAAVREPPSGGVELLTDVDAPLLGPRGAAAVFSPQKGADAEQVALLDRRLARWVNALEAAGAPPVADQPGAGAAGGAGYGFMALWGATATPGAARVASITGLDTAVQAADALITGEGRFDATSLTGKVVGHGLELARVAGVRATVIAGVFGKDPSVSGNGEVNGVSPTELAGSSDAALAEPRRWLIEAGSRAATQYSAQ